jgi:hypothetical protein
MHSSLPVPLLQDEGTTLSRNVRIRLSTDTASYPRITEPSATQLRKAQNSRLKYGNAWLPFCYETSVLPPPVYKHKIKVYESIISPIVLWVPNSVSHIELVGEQNVDENSIYFTPTNAHVKPLFCSFYCKMYSYKCFDPRIIVMVFFFFKKATITSTAYFEGSNSTHVLIFVLKYLNFKIHKTLKLMIYKLKS